MLMLSVDTKMESMHMIALFFFGLAKYHEIAERPRLNELAVYGI